MTFSSSTDQGVELLMVSVIRTKRACCVAKLMTVSRFAPVPVAIAALQVVPSFEVVTE